MTPRIRLLVNGLLVLALIGAAGLVVLGWNELPTAAVWGRVLIGAGLAGAIAIGVMFFLPLELRANLTLMGAAILVTVWIASWVLYEPPVSRREQRQRDFEAAARAAGVPFDTRTPLQVIKYLRRSGVDAAPTLSAWAFFGDDPELGAGPVDAKETDGVPAIVPLAGPSRTTTVACNEQGDYLIIDSDRYGFNNPDDVYATSVSPALILGDSFAFGFCVRPGGDIGSQLRARDLDVVNLGYPGAGPLLELAHLREYGRIIKPSVILWLYYHGNDLVNLSEEHGLPALRRYLDAGHHENLAARQPEIDTFWGRYVDRAVRRGGPRSGPPLQDVLLLQPLRERLVGRAAAARTRSKASIERFEESLEAMIAEAETLDTPLYFVFLPTYGQFAERDGDSRLQEDRDAVLGAVRSRGLPVIDFEARLREAGDPLQYYPYREQGHYTEVAYALLAEQILGRLRQDSVRIPMSARP